MAAIRTSPPPPPARPQQAAPTVPLNRTFKSIDARHIDGPDVLINTYMARSAFEYNPQMLTKIKEEWIEKELKNRAAEFTQPKTVSVFCGTWNVNGQVPKEDLSPWFTCESLPDIIAIGFQELDLSAEAFVFNDSGREEKWTKVIEGSIKGIEQYTKLKSRQLVGMLLIVYVKTPHIPFIANIQSEVTGTGIMSVMGNKGGVAIRFRIYDSDLCFVNSHLAADSGRVDRRNQDYLDICRRTLFTGARNVQFTIFDADILFWIGDLNYRIPLPDGDVKQAIKNREFANLLVNDELNIERAALRVFVGFEEGPIDFVPTYKYDVGTDNYDTSEKQRTPAWCDRILWKGKNVTQLFYRSHQQMRGSDHKPVAALFDIKVQIVLNEKLQEVRQRIVRDLDKMENECMPDATISTNHIDFGEVHYMQPVTQTLVISNIGQVICQYRFIPKLDEKKFCKPWMWIEPPMGMIVPGNKAQIRFTVLVDNATVAAMNAGDDKVEDILILHLENGKDYFVSVTGNYLKTCFGMPLDDLSKKHGAIREPPPADHLIDLTDALKVAEPVPKEGRAHVPHEIWNLVDLVYQRGMDEENLFMTSGNTEEMVQVRDDLDVGRDLNARYSVHSVAETLIRLLEALPEPVIPFSHYQRCLDCCNSYVLCKQLITQLPPAHSETFVYLISFLRECLAHKERNLLSPEKIALLFGSVLMRSHKKEVAKYAEAVVTKKKATFIFNFLVDDDETAQRSPLPLTATPSAAPLIQF
eukprot:Opistho-2@21651